MLVVDAGWGLPTGTPKTDTLRLLQGDVTHRLAGPLQDPGRIIQVSAARESEEYAHIRRLLLCSVTQDKIKPEPDSSEKCCPRASRGRV
jgi:hypothetical protein